MVSSSAVLLLLALGHAQEAALCTGVGEAVCEDQHEHHVQLLQQKVKVALKADGEVDEPRFDASKEPRRDGQGLPLKPKFNKKSLIPLQHYKPLPKRIGDKHGLAFISRGKGTPELEKGGNHISQEAEEAIEHLLVAAQSLEEEEHQGTTQDGTDGEPKSETAELFQELDAAMATGESDTQIAAMLNQHHDQLVHAIDQEEMATDVENMPAADIITTEILDELSQLPGTPERTDEAKASMTVQADMVAENADQFDLLQQAANSSARFLINFPKWEMPIRYCFDPNIAPSSRIAFQDAVQHFLNRVPCLEFVEVAATYDSHCSAQPAIYVQSSDSGCYANVGRMSVSVCNLQPQGCDTMGIAAHELGHNLGMLHEQSRSDAGEHVRILWDNIQRDYRDQYEQEAAADVKLEYDIMSLMHYGDTSFGIVDASGHSMKTMTQKKDTGKVMGNRMGLTNLDAKQVAAAYCGTDYTHEDFKVCTNDADSCTAEECICHQDPRSDDPIIKVGEPGCHKCLQRCPTAPYGTSGACGCPAGCSTSSFESGGRTYTMCNEGCQAGHDHPEGQPEPPPPLPPAPAGFAGGSSIDDPDARKTVDGCVCRKDWCIGAGGSCHEYCCNPDSDPGGNWCFKEDESCGGVNWGYCGEPSGPSSTDSSSSSSSGSSSGTSSGTSSGSTVDSSSGSNTGSSSYSSSASSGSTVDSSTGSDITTNNDDCMYSEDGMCDETVYCMEGTDCTDCGNCDGGEPHPFGYLTSSGSTSDWSSGSWSSGNWSSDNWSSGNWSSGNWSSGNWSSGNWSSGSEWSSDPSSPQAQGEACSDYYAECAWYVNYCNSGSLIDGFSFFEACKRSCGWCEPGTDSTCFDYVGSITCETYKDPYCDPAEHGFIDGLPFQDACRATCDGC
jgi:hypothetical protein